MGIIQDLEQISKDTQRLMEKTGEVEPSSIFRLFEDVFPTLPANQPNQCDQCGQYFKTGYSERFCSERCAEAYDEAMIRWKENIDK